MSISGISDASLAATIRQMQLTAKGGTSTQTSVEQAALAPVGGGAVPSVTLASFAGGSPGRHAAGGLALNSADASRSDEASSNRSNHVDTLV